MQAHSPKQDRAVAISARNFIRALGGAAGLAIASSIFSNTLVDSVPRDIPMQLLDRITESVFEIPDLSGLSEDQQDGVRDAYANASRAVFYLWVAGVSICLVLMLLVKDNGLTRNEEKRDGQATAGPVTTSEPQDSEKQDQPLNATQGGDDKPRELSETGRA